MRSRQRLIGPAAVLVMLVAACGTVGSSVAPEGSEPVTTTEADPGSPASTSPALAAPAPAAVTVATDETTYDRGERIVVAISNGLSESVVAEADGDRCAVLEFQRWEAAGWVDYSVCTAAHPADLTLAAASTFALVVEPGAPIVGGPVPAELMDEDLRTLPTLAPADPLPATEVPLGVLPPSGESGDDVLGGVMVGEIEPGRYRIGLSLLGRPSIDTEPVYSNAFTVE